MKTERQSWGTILIVEPGDDFAELDADERERFIGYDSSKYGREYIEIRFVDEDGETMFEISSTQEHNLGFKMHDTDS